MRRVINAIRGRIGYALQWLFPIKVSVTFPAVKIRLARVEWQYFRRGRLKNLDSLGYSRLEKLPTLQTLEKYYASEYWGSYRPREDRNVNSRDLVHFDILRPHLSDEGVFLNFGAGHGGISHLFDALGRWKVFEVEPSSEGAVGRINSVKSLQEVGALDCSVIYSSHSLEHVSDLQGTLRSLLGLSSPQTLFFFEVPDGELDAKSGRPVAPHTYYFREEFFKQLFTDWLDCRETKYQGGSLRALGKGLNRRFIESID